MLTRAVRRGDRYMLNGEKMWITNGSIADVALIWAKCEDEKIRGFLVEKGTKGFKAWDVHGKFSLRASSHFRPGDDRLRNSRGKCACPEWMA